MEWWELVLVACVAVLEVSHGVQKWPEAQCGMENMQVVVPQGNYRIKVLNKDGKMEPLRNNPSCGVWVTQKYDGSVLIGTSYDGCYVSQTDTDFVFTLGLITKKDGKKVTVRKMTCAVETYQDSPASDQCDSVSQRNRLRCAASQSSCTDVGCCYDPSDTTTPCFYGNKVTASCTADGLFSIAIPMTMTLPALNLTSVHLLESGNACNPIDGNNVFLLYQFPVSSCGTTFKVIGDQAVYENQLVATKTLQTWNGISIARDSTFRLLVRCTFAVSGFLPLKVAVVTLPPPPPVSSEGPLSFELRIGLDSTYGTYYNNSDYPVVKVLRDPVFVEVRILQKSDPNLVLVLHQCWATPSPDPLNAIQWPILINGCPFANDNYQSELIPVAPSSAVPFPTHYSRFDMMTFTFVDPNTQESIAGQVYIQCSVSACVPSTTDNCATVCTRSKRSARMLRSEETVLVSSHIPIYFMNSLPEAQGVSEGMYGVKSFQLDTMIIGIAVAMGIFAVVLLMMITWTLRRQWKSGSVLISKSPAEERTVHIHTISS